MKLDAIAMKLQVDGLGIIGTSIFEGDMPAGTDGILLLDAKLGTPIDYELPGYRNTHFNVAVRQKTYKKGRDLIESVMASLTITEVELTGMSIKYIRPRIEPVSFPVSESGIFEFLVIFDAVYVIVQ